MSQPSAAFVAQAHEAGGASFYHRYNSMANWEPYTAAQNTMILDAMTRSPDSGSMPLQLGTAQFEIRWGSEAKSRNMSRAEFGILQVNLRSGNSRDVKGEPYPLGGSAAPAAPPRMFKRAPSFIESGFSSRTEYEQAMKGGMHGHEDELVPVGGSIAHAHWYWQEDAHAIGKHDALDVKQPGNFVRYAGSVCSELDGKWASWLSSGKSSSFQTFPIDLQERIGSTGNERKANNEHTGYLFEVDLQEMVQRNIKSRFARKMQRDEFQPAVAAPPAPAPVPASPNISINISAPPAPVGPIAVDTTGDGFQDSIAVDSTGDGVPNLIVPNPQMVQQAQMAQMGQMQQAMGQMAMGPGSPGGGGGPPQLMKVAVPPGLKGCDTMQVQTPKGLMNVPIPVGLHEGDEFEFAM